LLKYFLLNANSIAVNTLRTPPKSRKDKDFPAADTSSGAQNKKSRPQPAFSNNNGAKTALDQLT
jgi:hypothetical protein